MEGVRDALATAHALLLSWSARLSGRKAGVVLVYHRVGGTRRADPAREILPPIPADVFGRQVRHLVRNYQVVPVTELLDAVRSRRRGGRFPVAITFDDDLSSHVGAAAPVLRREHAAATFFLGGTSLDAPHPFWWEDLQRAVDEGLVDSLPHVDQAMLEAALARAPKAIFRVAEAIERLSPNERAETATALRTAVGASADDGLREGSVRSLAGEFHIGFHTLRHDALPALSDTELERALQEGRRELAAAAQTTLDTISYPHGKADDRVAAAALAAGFRLGFTTKRGAVTPESNPLLIPRVPPTPFVGKTVSRVARVMIGRG